MKTMTGIEFLNRLYKDLIHTKEVKRAGKGGNKDEDLNLYMEKLKKIESKAKKTGRMDILKYFYHEKYVIKEQNIPPSYFDELIIRNNNDKPLTREEQNNEIKNIITAQKDSLDKWIDYFSSSSSEKYPTWFKFFVFKGITNIGTLKKDCNGMFVSATRRLKNTTNPFIEINEKIIEILYKELNKVLINEQLDDEVLEQLIKNGSFSKIYIHCLNKLLMENINYSDTDGIWKKYSMKINPKILYDDLYGKGTNWCTATSYKICESHINGGDFYVYYTKDSNGAYTVPRIAIRMIGTNYIEEIRGIANDQNLESQMLEILNEKLEEIGGKKNYHQEKIDMRKLDIVYNKYLNKENLAREELIFLYELQREIRVLGYEKDIRIQIIKDSRNKIADYNLIFKGIDNYDSNIKISDIKQVKGLVFPRIINGDLNLPKLQEASEVIFPEIINGSLYLDNIKNISDSKLPNKVKKIIINCSEIENIDLSNIEVEEISFPNLKKYNNLKLPKIINGTLSMNKIETLHNFELPNIIKGNLYLNELKTVVNSKFPDIVEGNVELENLTNFDKLKLPNIVNGDLNLKKLEKTDNLILPLEVHGTLKINNVKDISNIVMPKKLGGINLSSIKEGKLDLPEIMTGDVGLGNIIKTNGIKLPKVLKGSLYLSSVKQLNKLMLPEEITGYLNLGYLENGDGVILPNYVGKDIYLMNIRKAPGLKLPEIVEGIIYLNNLEDASGIIIPDNLQCRIICTKYNNDINALREASKKTKRIA